jgi:hypothetical protein
MKQKVSNEQILAARAKAISEIDALTPVVGPDSAYGRALADGVNDMPKELRTEALHAQRMRYEYLTTARLRWESADAEARFSRMRRENDR